MEDRNKHMDSPDDFSRAIQERLKDYRLPIENMGWEEMERKWQTQQVAIRRKRMVWMAAAIIPLLLLVPLRWISQDQKERAIFPEIKQTISEKISSSAENEDREDMEDKIAELQSPAIPLTKSSLPSVTVTDDTDVSREEEEKKTGPETIPEEKEPENAEPEPAFPSFHDPVLVPRKERNDLLMAYQPVKKKSSSWQIGAGLATGGGVSLDFGNGNDMMHLNPEDPSPSNPEPPVWQDPDGEIIPGHYNDYSYSIPFSVQISLRKQFTKWMGIEAGLQYSYLSTRFYSSSNNLREARSDLHYLGIPVNLVATAWRQHNWNIYFSAGITLEKGLRQNIRKYGRPGLFPDDISVGKSIPGVQWSLNVAPGISYRIFKEWDFYVEPRFSYFFDSDQPYSIRTDKPVVIGIAGGLRYSF